jgi:hypothetical protein
MRQYRADNPARVLLQLAKQRAGRLGVPFSITEEDIRIPKRCPVLGIRLKHGIEKLRKSSPSLDRLNPRLGYVPGNVAVISFMANAIKSNATPKQLEKVSKWVNKRVHLQSAKV